MHEGGALPAGGASQEPMAAERRPEIVPLTSIRFVAAMEVVLLHTLFELGGPAMGAGPNLLTGLLTRGGQAVSLFFVLSGFILAYTYCDADGGLRGTPGKFWRARFARIYPLYVLGFVMDAPRVIAFFAASAASLATALLKIAVAAFAYLTLLQSWHPRLSNTWNTPGWSLSTEAFFYAVFPALIALTKRWPLRRLLLAALLLWAAPIALHMALAASHRVDLSSPNWLTLWRSFPPFRLGEFALGVVAGRWLLSGRLRAGSTRLRFLGVLALVLILFIPVCSRVLPEPVVELSLAAPLFAIAIVAVASGALPTPRWLSGSTLALLGRASYAVYIIHQPFKAVFMSVAKWAGLAAPSAGLLIAFVVSLQLTCVALFVWFEDPLRRAITRSRTAAEPVTSGR